MGSWSSGAIKGLPGIVAASRSYAVMEPSKETTRSHRPEQNMNSQYRSAITQRFLVNFVSSDLQPTSALLVSPTPTISIPAPSTIPAGPLDVPNAGVALQN